MSTHIHVHIYVHEHICIYLNIHEHMSIHRHIYIRTNQKTWVRGESCSVAQSGLELSVLPLHCQEY